MGCLFVKIVRRVGPWDIGRKMISAAAVVYKAALKRSHCKGKPWENTPFVFVVIIVCIAVPT